MDCTCTQRPGVSLCSPLTTAHTRTDWQSLSAYVSGNAVHMVKAAGNRAQQQAAEAGGSPSAVAGSGGGGGGGRQAADPFGGMGGAGMPNLGQIDQMMENPMVQGLMNNPDVMREMMMNNPQVRGANACVLATPGVVFFSRLKGSRDDLVLAFATPLSDSGAHREQS